jgi:hypothetical protein
MENLEEFLEGGEVDLLVLEDVDLFRVAVHQREAVGHGAKQRMLFLRQEIEGLFEVSGALVHHQPQHVVKPARGGASHT